MDSRELNEFARQTWTYVPPVVVSVGTIGNLLTIIAVTGGKMQSFTVYLLSLAVSDILVLYTQTFNLWLENVLEIELKEYGAVLCKLHYFLIFLCPMISAWLIVCLTIERTICMCNTHRVRKFPGPKVGLTVVGVTVSGLCALNAHTLYGRQFVTLPNATHPSCEFVDDGYRDFYYYYWNMINFCAYFVVPIILIVVGNAITSFKVYQSARTITAFSALRRKTRHVFILTLMVSIAFIVLVTPLPLMFLFTRVNTLHFPAALFVHMTAINHAINFFLYVLSGRRFRENLKLALLRIPKKLCNFSGQGAQGSQNLRDQGGETTGRTPLPDSISSSNDLVMFPPKLSVY